MRRNDILVIAVCAVMLLATSGVSLAASWAMLGGDSAHTGYRAEPVALPVSLLWKYTAAGEGAVVTVWSSPAASDDAVFFCYDTSVYCVDRMTGELRWQYQTQTQVRSSPAIDDRGVYVGGSNGVLYAIDCGTGRLMWQYPTPGRKAIDSSPVIDKGVLYVGGDDASLYAIDLETRQLKWQFRTIDEIKAPPMVRTGVCYAVSVDGTIYAIDDRGRQIWQASLGPGPAFAGPSFERDKILAPAGNRVVALDARTGIRRWTFDAPGDLVSSTPAVANRMMYVGSKDGSLYGVNANTGKAVWRYPSGTDEVTQPILSGPAVSGDTVFARTENGIIVGVNAQSGKLQWRYKMAVPATKAARAREGGGGGEEEEEEQRPQEEEEEQRQDEGGDEEGFGGFGGGRGSGGSSRGAYRSGRSAVRLRNQREPTPGFGSPYGKTSQRQGARAQAEFADSVLAALAVSGNAVYALGDDGALYALDAGAADRDAPQVSEAVLQIPGADRNIYGVSLDIANGDQLPGQFAGNVQVPGTPPLYVSVKLFDEGSGVDTSTIRVSLDGQPQRSWTFDEKQDLLWFSYSPGGIPRPLPNGQHDLVVEASDYRGQTAVKNLSFVVDNALPAPSAGEAGGAGGGEEEEEEENPGREDEQEG